MSNSRQIVSDDELTELTGFASTTKQKECLDQHGIFYIKGKNGQIRTTWGHINNPLKMRMPSNADGFNLEALSNG
ncbi:MAG: DUF4224 domain-containing protein [Candidatus Oceanisphaera merdipullorum]|nr:DUF4224 domain-containing protein [Candidatus Oceanisphaera merdipullorum]